MSALVHCDGPDCDETRGQDNDVRAFCTPHWIHVEQDRATYDFHSRTCLAKWAGALDLIKVQEAVWWEGYNAAERDALKAPPATVTPCPYKTGVGRP